MNDEKLLAMETGEIFVTVVKSSEIEKQIEVLRVPNGWIIDDVFVPEPFEGEIITGEVKSNPNDADILIRKAVGEYFKDSASFDANMVLTYIKGLIDTE